MYSIKNIFAAIVLSTSLSVAAQAAETVKPLQGISFHTETKDAVAYYLADKGACKVIVTLADKTAYAPTRFEKAVEAHKSALYQVDAWQGTRVRMPGACTSDDDQPAGDGRSEPLNLWPRA